MAQSAIGFEQAAQVSADHFRRGLADQARHAGRTTAGLAQTVQQQKFFQRTVVYHEGRRTITRLLLAMHLDPKEALQQGRHLKIEIRRMRHAHPNPVVIILGSHKTIPGQVTQEERQFFVQQDRQGGPFLIAMLGLGVA